MKRSVHAKISIGLKVPAVLFGVGNVLWGIMLAVGFGPDGAHGSLFIQFMGFIFMLIGAIYLVPNSKIEKHSKFKVLFLFITILIPAIFLISLISIISTGGFKYQMDVNTYWISLVGLLMTITAPMSFYYSIKK